jgi:hypothetical protein
MCVVVISQTDGEYKQRVDNTVVGEEAAFQQQFKEGGSLQRHPGDDPELDMPVQLQSELLLAATELVAPVLSLPLFLQASAFALSSTGRLIIQWTMSWVVCGALEQGRQMGSTITLCGLVLEA